MKKTMLTLAAGCACIWGIFLEASSQVVVNTKHPVDATHPQPDYHRQSALPANGAHLYRNDISVRAVRDFIREFRNAENVTWQKATNGGFTAQFKKDSVQTTVNYTHKGSFNFTLRRYAQNKMPAEVRTMINKAFIGYSITDVSEIETIRGIENIIYSVLINYLDNYKIVKISKLQMQVVTDYSLR